LAQLKEQVKDMQILNTMSHDRIQWQDIVTNFWVPQNKENCTSQAALILSRRILLHGVIYVGYLLGLLQVLHCRLPHLEFKMKGTMDPCHIGLCLQLGASITFAALQRQQKW